MICRLVSAVVIVGAGCAVAAREVAEFAPADLTLAKRLLVRHKISDVTFLKKDRGMIAMASPPALLQWTAHIQTAEPAGASWTFTTRTAIPVDQPRVRALLNSKSSAVPDADLQRMFAEVRAKREQVRVRYIFIPRMPPKMSARAAKRHIDKFRRELDQGMDFEDLAKRYSVHESAPAGGDLGFIGRGALPSAVEAFAFVAEPGQISPVIDGEEGLHIARVEERKTPSFESVRAELEDMWLTERLGRESSRQLVTMAANARRIAVASAHLVVLYDVVEPTQELVPVFAFVEERPVDAIALTGGGNVIAAAAGGEVVVRRVKQDGAREPVSGAGTVQSLLFSPNATFLALVRDRTVDLVNISDRTVTASVTAGDTLTAVAFSRDSRTLVTGDQGGGVELWDATTYERVRNGESGYEARYWTDRTWRRLAKKNVDAAPVCFVFHPAGRLFVAGLRSGALEAFDLASGGRMPLRPAKPHDAALIRAAFSEDGTFLVTAAGDETIGVWSVPDEFKIGPKPRPRTYDELVLQHREVVRVHAEFRTKREELIRLQSEYENQARYLRDNISQLMTQQELPNWRAVERLPEGNALLRGLQAALGYRDELEVAIDVLRLSMIDLENIARFQVMEINARRVLDPEQFERFAAKLEEISLKAPSRPDPTVAPKRVPTFDKVWQYVLTGDMRGMP